MVPEAGIEPARPYERGILSPMRLPVSPFGRQRGEAVYAAVRYKPEGLTPWRLRDKGTNIYIPILRSKFAGGNFQRHTHFATI